MSAGIEPPEDLPLEAALEAVGPSLALLCSSLARSEQPQTVFLTSPHEGAGCTLLSACLALALVRSARTRVTLIEANFHSPTLAPYLNLEETPGILDVLKGHDAEAAVRNSKVSGLRVLTAGARRAPAWGELNSAEASGLFEQVIGRTPFTIVDAPPLLEHPESQLLYRHATSSILVVRAGKTSRRDARAACEILESTNASVLGMIVNGAKSRLPGWPR